MCRKEENQNGASYQQAHINNSKQEMPSWQQKSTKKGSKRYIMFGPNHILITLRWNDRRSPGHENVCW